MAAYRSLYNVLNVSSGAEPVVIEAAYRALMKKYHPDQAASPESSGAAEINAAFAILRDPERRAEYDRREWQRQQDVLRAQYSPPVTIVRRGTGLFGWTGWVLATALGALILSAVQGGGIALLRQPGKQTAVVFPTPRLGSQPAMQDELLVTPASILLDPEPAAVETPDATVAAAAPPLATPHAASGNAAKPHRPRAPTRRAPTAAETDFREREGYIY